jgi:hypothetical protein
MLPEEASAAQTNTSFVEALLFMILPLFADVHLLPAACAGRARVADQQPAMLPVQPSSLTHTHGPAFAWILCADVHHLPAACACEACSTLPSHLRTHIAARWLMLRTCAPTAYCSVLMHVCLLLAA